MYRKNQQAKIKIEEFEFSIEEGKLDGENRWIIMAELIPWEEFEAEYAKQFAKGMGAPAKSFRIALGALIIKEMLGISDRETVEQIKENPYLQYFIGRKKYSKEAAFEASMLVHFRERIGIEMVSKITRKMVEKQVKEAGVEENNEKK